MTGHKSNSFLKPLISLKEFLVVFCFVFLLLSFQGRRGRKGEKVVKQWALLVRTGKETVAPFLRDGGGKQKKKSKNVRE